MWARTEAWLVGIYWKMTALTLRRPWLLPAVLGAAWAFRRRQWHRRFPFLPVPSRIYLRWRMETAYGAAEAVPPYDELERYLRWARGMRRRAREARLPRRGRGSPRRSRGEMSDG